MKNFETPVRGRSGGVLPARRLTTALLLNLALALGCAPSQFALEPARGRVVDEDTGAGIAGAEVLEWYRGAGTSDVAPHVWARWTTTDAEGTFAFPRRAPAPARLWLLKSYGPSYSFYHVRYGLEHGARNRDGALALSGSTTRAEQRRANLAPICRGERDDPGARHLAKIACKGPRPKE